MGFFQIQIAPKCPSQRKDTVGFSGAGTLLTERLAGVGENLGDCFHGLPGSEGDSREGSVDYG
jgi:hypothetical protein